MTISKTSHPYEVPSDTAGSRRETAQLLVGTAEEFDINQRAIKTTMSGFRITQELYDALGWGDEDGEDGEDGEGTGDGDTSLPVTSDPEEPNENPGEVIDYATWEYNDLKAEVARRELEVDDQKAATLVSALEASDADETESDEDDNL